MVMQCSWLVVIVALFIGCVAANDEIQPSLLFRSSTLFLNSTHQVLHMEVDRYKHDGSILIGSSQNHLQTTNGQTTTTLISDLSVSGFTQINRTHLAIVAQMIHCIKILNRDNMFTQTLAGTCGTNGYAEGRVGVGRLYNPWGVVLDIRNPGNLLVTDKHNNALRSVDLRTGELSTVINMGFNEPVKMLWANGTLLVVNHQHYISQVSWLGDEHISNNVIAGSIIEGDVLGGFDVAKFSFPFEIERVGYNMYMVSDYGNKKLKLLDMNRQKVGIVCYRHINDTATNCNPPDEPVALLNVNNTVYVGPDEGQIYAFSGTTFLPDVCPHKNITALLALNQSTVSVYLGEGQTESFPEGIHIKTVPFNSRSCTYYVIVERARVKRRLSFKSEFDVRCELIDYDNDSRRSLRTSIIRRKDQLQSICEEDCMMSSTMDPFFDCTNDHLTVYWPTDNLYNTTSQSPPATLSNKLKRKLSQSNVMKNMEIFIIFHSPPAIAANKNSRGESVDVVLYSTCVDQTKPYNVGSDQCT